MSLKNLPIGFSSLSEVITRNCVYVDKTPFVRNLVAHGKYYFLSRPRRFGKSLFLDTLHQAFAGNQQVFTGLYLEKNWDWTQNYPVIHMSLGAGVMRNREELDRSIHTMLDTHYQQYGLKNDYVDVSTRFADLVRKLYQVTQKRVVILIDEYDKPILDNIDDLAKAVELREGLKNFYSIIKDYDEYLGFVFLTGVSKFSKVSLFSGLNNLEDISLNANYADICGYTQADIEQVFKDYLGNVDLKKLQSWYNGYNFNGTAQQKVYNPFDILLFISNNKEYKSYWFETGTPTFLIKLFEKNKYYLPDLEKTQMAETSLSSIDIESISIEALALQTGYLTIKRSYEQMGRLWFELTYPNQEVKVCLNECLAKLGVTDTTYNQNVQRIYNALSALNFDLFKATIQAFFSSIPHDWYRNNHINQYEGFYCSIVYSYFCAAGYTVIGEDVTNKGQIDLTIHDHERIFIFEFKLKSATGSATEALTQIKDKNYATKYSTMNKPIYLLGMVFDAEARNLVDFAWEKWNG